MPCLACSIDFRIKHLTLDGNRVKCQIWDTAGQERFRTITTSYFKGAHGVALCFDTTDRKSFASITHWIQQIAEHGDADMSMVLIGTKADMEATRQVTEEEARKLAREHKTELYLTSARSNTGITECFEYLAREAMQKSLAVPAKAANNTVDVAAAGGGAGAKAGSKGGCC